MYNNSQDSDITIEELLAIFSQLSETDKQTVREFIYSISSSSKYEPPLDLSVPKN